MHKEIEKTLNKVVATIFGIIIMSSIGLFIINVGTTIHEFTLHNTIARLMGCEAESGIQTFGGVTEFDCPKLTNLTKILIALAAPIGVFSIGLPLVLWSENSFLKVVGLMMLFYSSIPSMFPSLSGSDMYYAISQGFNPIFGWLLYITTSGITIWLFVEEVIDRKVFR